MCDCGAVRYAAAVAVERGYITSCGSDECKNKIKKSKRAASRAKVKIADKKPLLPLLKPEEEWSYKEERQVPAIIERLKPKWFCKRPVTDCAINQFCHLCCQECDRSCHHDVCSKGLYYFVTQELYSKHENEIKTTCKEKGAGLIVDGYPITTVLKPKVRKDVKPLSDNGYIHYLRLFAKKWARKRELIDECNIK